MKPFLRFLLPALALSALATLPGHSQDNPLFRHLPPDAETVFQINLPAITSKVPWKDISAFFPETKGHSGKDVSGFLKDPAAAGIDITRDIFITDMEPVSPGSVEALTLLLHLVDSGKFVSFFRSQEAGIHFLTYPGKGRTARKDKMGIAWNKELAILTILMPPFRKVPPRAGQAIPHYDVEAARKSFDALMGFPTSFYTTDPIFRNGFSDDADFHLWAGPGKGLSFLSHRFLRSASPIPGMNALPQTAGKTKTHTLSTVRFETGRITIRSSTIFPPDDLAPYARLIGKPLNTDLVARIPKGNLLALASLHFDPSAIGDLLDKYGMRNKADSAAAAKKLSLGSLLQAFKGDFLLAVLSPDPPTDSTPPRKQPSLFFVVPINDLSAFQQLAAHANLMRGSDSTTMGSDDSSASKPPLLERIKSAYTLRDNTLVISDSKARTEAFFNSMEKRNTDFITESMKNSPLSVWIDFKPVRDFLQHMKNTNGNQEDHPSPKNEQALHFLSALDQLGISLGNIHDGRVETSIELKMTDPSENSLRTLFHLVHP